MSSSFRRLEFTPTVTISLSRTMSPSLLVRLWTWIRQSVTTSVFSDGKSPQRRFGRKQPCSYIPRAMDDGNISFSKRKLKQRGDNKALYLIWAESTIKTFPTDIFRIKNIIYITVLCFNNVCQQCPWERAFESIKQVNRDEENQNVHEEFFIVKLSMSTLKSIRSLTFWKNPIRSLFTLNAIVLPNATCEVHG